MNHSFSIVDSQQGRVLLNEASYCLVRKNAPEELPLYVETRDQYLANPEEFTKSSNTEDEVLGIGEVVAVKTFTKIVFPIITPILKYLVETVTEAFKEELGKDAVEWVRGLFSAKVQPQPIFSQEELEVIISTIDNIATTEANRLGLDVNQVLTIRDAVITQLVLAKK